MTIRSILMAGGAVCAAGYASAAELEVMHWWTSGGEAAAVAELADALNERTEHTWVDGAIAGTGQTARPIMISRITGGDPMAAFQFNHGRQAEELIEAGLLRDMTDVAEAQGWKDIVNPPLLLDACTVDGRIYCAPISIHSWQWLWLSHKAYEDAGIPVPTNWAEFVNAAPALEAAGKVPLAMGQQGWQQNGAFQVMMISLLPKEVYLQVYRDKDAEKARGPEVGRIFQALAQAREMSRDSRVQDWNQATNMVITGEAGGQIMGDWAQGEFQLAGLVAGEDYTCLPGLGGNPTLQAGGDAFYFPALDDPEMTAAQGELAALLLDPQTQVAFNLKKGSLPVRGDIDLSAANECMQKGLEILASGEAVPDVAQLISADSLTRIEDVFVQFFADETITAEEAQEQFAALIEDAD
ncbi:ABC transporter substrate-binding protein [Paracoccus sp. 1_MG-2023]|uniref:ABC transporter substrate-binding protein n=1 Tax=unclassified Paracoccus (in: a-proteobacteria) TaxID=2688777 RepID=UPI001C0969C4|nr:MULTISPECIES: ABC transporter substrate-binding protein [unclassified Paracoccus (in: a-proteobacteria)]MBU2957977.1 ABC transporter substrate-binding protein [Paracoccus sp. C2R09]MDO6668829.1 ABC transporter substrate-binding protein [Paracoccus sp. 1_MG-2023]